MWNRKELKKNGKRHFLRNWAAVVAVCFLLAFVGAEYVDSVDFVRQFDPAAMLPEGEVIVQQVHTSNWDLMLGWLQIDPSDGTHPMWAAADQNFSSIFNTLTQPFSAFFAFLERSSFAGWTGITLALLGVLGGLWFSIWVVGVLSVGARRFLLESRVRDHISLSAMFSPMRRGCWWNAAKTMLLRSVYTLLWSLTIIGLPIKMYSYRMVPYILAENPGVSTRDAITLSRRMMNGNKWRCFVIDASFFLHWSLIPSLLVSCAAFAITLAGVDIPSPLLISVVTGLLSLLFVNGYKACTFTGLYVALRQEQLDQDTTLSRLFTVPAFGEDQVSGQKEKLTFTGVSAPAAPVFHFAHRHKLDYNRPYPIRTLVLLFFAFAFAGWAWEVALHIVTQGMFINRGTMFGPWLPIYGAGGALVLLLLKKLFKSPPATFLVSMVLCSIIEYFTSWYLEYTKGIRWWDYSGYFMNLNGRICLEGAVVFGLGCCAVVYLAGPLLAGLIDRKLSPAAQNTLCIVLVSLFAADAVYSHFHPNAGKGITDYNDWQQTAAVPKDAFLPEAANDTVAATVP